MEFYMRVVTEYESWDEEESDLPGADGNKEYVQIGPRRHHKE